MAEKPTLYVCHGDDGGPRVHPCRRVQEALRENLEKATGSKKLPALKLPDGSVLTQSKAILRWVEQQA